MTGPVKPKAQALALFKDLIDLTAADRAARLSTLAATDSAVHAQVVRMLARDAESDARFDVGAGQRVLAADLLVSMLANHDAMLDDGPMPDHIGPYRVIGVLGRGGMGVVYEGEQADPLRRVAIKTMHAHLHAPDTLARFAFEMQALASLTHRSIPRLYEVRHDAGRTWMVMELVRGIPIARYVEQRPLRERLELFLEVLDGVAFAHEADIGHRDLKSANILVADGQPRILDFGLAASLNRAEERAGIAGTLATMAPEQLERDAPIDHRADVYALGVLLYELLTGELPLVPTGMADALRQKLAAAPPQVSARGLDRDFDFMLARALAPRPDDRYRDVRAFQSDLRAHLASRPIDARPNTLVYRARTFIARHRTAVRGVAATLAIVSLVAASLAVTRAIDAARDARVYEAAAAERMSLLAQRLIELDGRGAHDEGDRLFRYFAAMTDNAGTRALHDGWMREARRQRARDHDAATIAAYASAWSSARDDRQRVDALLELGDVLAAEVDRASVDQVAALLAGADDPRAQAFVTRVRDFHRDFAAGSAAGFLARGTALDVTATTATIVRDEASQHDHLIVLDQPAHALVTYEVDGGLRRRGETRLGDDVLVQRWQPSQIPGLPSFMVGPTTDGATRIFQVIFEDGRARLDTIATLPLWGGATSAGWRLADGTPLVLIGTAGDDRRLAAWRPDDPRVWVAPPELVGLPSDIDDLASADLDGDGRRELLVAAGAWSTYELRVLRATTSADRPFELAARRRMGMVARVMLLRDGDRPPLIAVVKADRYPSPRHLGPATPYGVAPGVHLLRFDGRALVDVAYAPFPIDVPREVTPHASFVGDLDGDGDDDLALGVMLRATEHMLLYLRTGPTELRPIVVGHATPLATAQLDADPSDELVVRIDDNQGWVLGLGDGLLPTFPSAAAALTPERWIAALAGLEVQQEARAVKAGALGAPSAVVIDQGRIDPAWHITRAGVVTRVPGTPAAIGIEATEATPLMTLPVHFEGGDAHVVIDLTLEQLEIGSGLRFAIVDHADQMRAQLAVTGSGGGESIERALTCGSEAREDVDRAQRAIAAPAERLRLHLAVSGARTICRVEHPSEGLTSDLVGELGFDKPPLAAGDYTLRIEGFGHTTWPTALLVRARVERVGLVGLVPRVVTTTPIERAHRAAFEGDPIVARGLYDQLPDDANAAFGGLLAALQIGDPADIAARVTRLVPAFEVGAGGVWGLVRSRPEAIAAPLYAADHDAFVTTFASAWGMARRYLDAAETQRMLELPAIATLTGASRAELELVLSAIRHDLRAGAFARAYRRAARALETPRPPDPELAELEAELLLFAAAAADGLDRGGDAREHLLAWLVATDAESPEIDTLGNRADTSRLVDYLR